MVYTVKQAGDAYYAVTANDDATAGDADRTAKPVAEGAVEADKRGLVTVEKFEINKAGWGNRLVIERAKQAEQQGGGVRWHLRRSQGNFFACRSSSGRRPDRGNGPQAGNLISARPRARGSSASAC